MIKIPVISKITLTVYLPLYLKKNSMFVFSYLL